jgi:hypothetical protein
MQSNKKGERTAHYYNDRFSLSQEYYKDYSEAQWIHFGPGKPSRYETQLLLSNVVIPSPLERVSLSSSNLGEYEMNSQLR